jgi:hypothetical protein
MDNTQLLLDASSVYPNDDPSLSKILEELLKSSTVNKSSEEFSECFHKILEKGFLRSARVLLEHGKAFFASS